MLKATNSILYEPSNAVKRQSNSNEGDQVMSVQENDGKIDLEQMIAMSRQTDAMFNINNTLSAAAHEIESKELVLKMSNSNSLLS